MTAKFVKLVAKRVSQGQIHASTWAKKFVLPESFIEPEKFLLPYNADKIDKLFDLTDEQIRNYTTQFCDSAKFASLYTLVNALLHGRYLSILNLLTTYVTENSLFKRCERNDKNFSGDMLAGFNLLVLLSLKILPKSLLADNLHVYQRVYRAYYKIFYEKPYGLVKSTSNDTSRGWVIPKNTFFHPYQLTTTFATLLTMHELNIHFGFNAPDYNIEDIYNLIEIYISYMLDNLSFKPAGYFKKVPLLGYCQFIEFYQIHSTLLNLITMQLSLQDNILLPIDNYFKFTASLNPDLIVLSYILEKLKFGNFMTDLELLSYTISLPLLNQLLYEEVKNVQDIDGKPYTVRDLKHACKQKETWYTKRLPFTKLRHEYVFEKNWFKPRQSIHPFYTLGLSVAQKLIMLTQQV